MIRVPKWAADAVPTPKGWVNSNGELLKSQKISNAQIKEFYGDKTVTDKPIQLNEAPQNNKAVDEMTVTELQNLGNENVETDEDDQPTSLIEKTKGFFSRNVD